MATHTPITDFMGMELRRFYQILQSIGDVMEKQRNMR